ncbi:hypothetical protein CAL12_00230 [Bordetella genomosp. 8]|uniref:DUF5666 domain-containing protein n=1 Tax=Bordetella genomosp. 8 TaxID=1416806 RepID=A0A1W6YEB1_9BORD|nr:hypothetical protein [Bordetella genomosp. 8]ARP79401.1 hypothetical protein CAL12_00230 [Bordetella genomosp. 8]
MNKHYRIGAWCAGVLLAAGMAAAQAQQAGQAPANRLAVRGTIEQITDTTLKVKARNGKDVTLALPSNVAVRAVSLAKLGDIKPDSFIGTAATPQPDGTLKALEVHVFAASLRGSGEGNRPWMGSDGKTGQMTNGTVGSLVGTNGTTMKVKYKDGEKTVVVPPDVPIVYMEPGDRSLLKTGAPVLVFPTKNADGGLTAATVIAGKDGTIPPM